MKNFGSRRRRDKLLPTTTYYYLLLPTTTTTTYYLLPTTYYLLPTTYYYLLLLPTTYYLLPTTYYLLLIPTFGFVASILFRGTHVHLPRLSWESLMFSTVADCFHLLSVQQLCDFTSSTLELRHVFSSCRLPAAL